MKVLDSWHRNASNWIKTIEQRTITSREITNQAILNIIKDYQPTRLCDVGCGEGWLTRSCLDLSISTVGIDGTASLIEYANKKKLGRFHLLDFEAIITGTTLPEPPYEAVVFNFCLYEKEQTEHLLLSIARQLHQRKLIFIQTLHPATLLQSGIQYQDQWMLDSWAGLSGKFTHPHRWYYRTLESWLRLFRDLQLTLIDFKEPTAHGGEQPSSVIFVLQGNRK